MDRPMAYGLEYDDACQSCGCELEWCDDNRCRGCGLFVCDACCVVFHHEGDSDGGQTKHRTGDPSTEIARLRAELGDRVAAYEEASVIIREMAAERDALRSDLREKAIAVAEAKSDLSTANAAIARLRARVVDLERIIANELSRQDRDRADQRRVEELVSRGWVRIPYRMSDVEYSRPARSVAELVAALDAEMREDG